MVLYDGEEEVVAEVERRLGGLLVKSRRVDEILKKKRELFHFLTFLKLSDGVLARNEIELLLPEDGEGADIELVEPEKRSIEVTECLDNINGKHESFKKAVNSLFTAGDSYYVEKNMSEGLAESFRTVLKSKNEKIQRYKKDGFRTELLIVTDTAYDNCPITGTWVEKFLEKNLVNSLSGVFDRIHILIYHASGKDGGPLIREFPEDYHKYQSLGED